MRGPHERANVSVQCSDKRVSGGDRSSVSCIEGDVRFVWRRDLFEILLGENGGCVEVVFTLDEDDRHVEGVAVAGKATPISGPSIFEPKKCSRLAATPRR
jgi:hypothetical protein